MTAEGQSLRVGHSCVMCAHSFPQDKKDDIPGNAQDLTAFVQGLLDQMVRASPSGCAVLSGSAEVLMWFWDSVWQQGRFNQMSEQIITKIDEMGSRIDDLERSISELMTQVRDVSLYIRVPVCLAKTDRNHSSPMLVWPSVCVKAGVEGPEQDILGGEQGSQHQQIGDGK